MKKVKAENEYDRHLLKKRTSKRDRREEEGFTLLPKPPSWAGPDNLWGEKYRYERQIDGWEKLCIEAYFSGWVDYFDTIIQGGAKEHTIYFKWEEEGKEEYASLEIYLDPSPKLEPAPPTPTLSATVPKPPPPPMS